MWFPLMNPREKPLFTWEITMCGDQKKQTVLESPDLPYRPGVII